ncbi:MAG: hypothetical protein SGPRY_006305, partial [Prymnesium sp.]
VMSSWSALSSLTQLALECGFTEEARYRLLTNSEELRQQLAESELAGSKLFRLLHVSCLLNLVE